jgi:hypothetical protein
MKSWRKPSCSRMEIAAKAAERKVCCSRRTGQNSEVHEFPCDPILQGSGSRIDQGAIRDVESFARPRSNHLPTGALDGLRSSAARVLSQEHLRIPLPAFLTASVHLRHVHTCWSVPWWIMHERAEYASSSSSSRSRDACCRYWSFGSQ